MLSSVWWIVLSALAAPLVVGLLARVPRLPRLPEVVFLLLLGIALGPNGLGLAADNDATDLLQDLGLGFLFFMAGLEIDPRVLKGSDGRRALSAWVLSLTAAAAFVGALTAAGLVEAWWALAIALTSTALGTLLPILRESGMNQGRFGELVLANGAVGEFGPIAAMSILLGSHGAWAGLVSLLAFAAVAGALSLALHHGARWAHPVREILDRGAETTAQAPIRSAVVLIVGLLVVASRFGLDSVLGAFVAGAIVRTLLPADHERFLMRLDGLAYGFFIPIFFVVSGMAVEVASVVESPAELLLAFGMIVLVRGLPVLLLHRGVLPAPQPLQLALLSATGLPIIVAVTALAKASGDMPAAKASISVAAGMLTVLVLPTLATTLRARAPQPA